MCDAGSCSKILIKAEAFWDQSEGFQQQALSLLSEALAATQLHLARLVGSVLRLTFAKS